MNFSKDDQEVFDVIQSLFKPHTLVEDIKSELDQMLPVCPAIILNESIVESIVKHALESNNIEENWRLYSEMINDVFESSMKGTLSPYDFPILYETIDVLLNFLDVSCEGFEKTRYYIKLHHQSQSTMNYMMSILNHGIALIIRSYGLLFVHAPILDICFSLARCPRYILDSDIACDTLVGSWSELCAAMAEFNLLQLPNDKIEELILKILKLMLSNSNSDNILDQLADTLTTLLQKNLKLKLILVRLVSDYAGKVANLRTTSISILTALLNLSCALLQNNGSVNWLDQVKNKVEKLPAQTQEIPQLFAATFRVHCFEKCVSERDDFGARQMEIDPNSQVSFIESQTPEKIVQRVDEYFKNEIISELINELVSSNLDDEIFLNQIEKIKCTLLYTDASPHFILEKYSKTLTEYGVGHIRSNPAIIESIARLYRVSVPQFLTWNMKFVTPYIVIDCEDKKQVFRKVAEILDSKLMILLTRHIYPIILRILLEQDESKLRKAIEFLRSNLFGQSINELVQEKETQLTVDLAMYLGRSDTDEQIVQAFERLTEMVNKTAASLSDILSNSLFGITMTVSHFISQKRNHEKIIDHPNAIEALKAIIKEIGPDINTHTMHLMKLFDAIYDVEGMQLEALELWTVLIHVLSPNHILSHLNAFLRRLIQFIHVVDKSTRKRVAKEIEYILLDGKLVITPDRYLSLPVIPAFDELEKTRKHVASKTKYSLREAIKSILKCLNDLDDAEVQSALHRLSNILKGKENEVEKIIGDIELASRLYSKLLGIARKYAQHKDIPYLAAICLGKLGATDPSILPVSVNDDNIIIRSNFENKEENVNFVADLIENYLIPAFHASIDEQVHQFIRYTIQTLLTCAGFSPKKIGDVFSSNRVSRERWNKFPTSTQEFLSPLLSSSYECEWSKLEIDHLIYKNGVTFTDWIHKWYDKLTNQASKNAHDIFKACTPVIRSGIWDVTHYLIPCLVLHVVQNDDSQYVSSIRDEMITVLNAAVSDVPDANAKKNLSSLKVVVSVTHHCRVWMRFKGNSTSEARSQVSIVNEFLNKIPDKLMAYASIGAKAYPQALMHYEKYLKERERIADNGSASVVNSLRQIYGHLNDKDSMQVLIDGYSKAFTVDYEWLQYENEMRWDIAEISLREQVRKEPNRLSSYTNYLDCLQKAGEYEKIIYTPVLPNDKIQWSPQVNSYKISAAWKTENWSELDQLVRSPLERKFEALLGSAICSMRKKDVIQAAVDLREARMTQIEILSTSHFKSYRDVYPIIFKLQQLQDLEDSQYAWESKDIKEITNLYKKWEKQFKNIIPTYNYQRDLLELRKAALFDMRLGVFTTNEEFPHNQSLYWNLLAKYARKSGNMKKAFYAINRADELTPRVAEYERAKWYLANNYKQSMLGLLFDNKTSVQGALLYIKHTQDNKKEENVNGTYELYRAAMMKDRQFEKIYYQASNHYFKLSIEAFAAKRSELSLQYLVRVLLFCERGLGAGSKYQFNNVANMINAWFDISREIRTYSDQKRMMNYREKIGEKLLSQVPPYQYIFSLPRLISHLTSTYETDVPWLEKMISLVFSSYPRSTIWLLLAASEAQAPAIKTSVERILNKAKERYSATIIPTVINQGRLFIDILKKFATYNTEKTLDLDLTQPRFSYLFEVKNLALYIPNERSLLPQLPENITKDPKVFPDDLPTIIGFGSRATVMKSLQKPKKFTLLGSDGKVYGFLAKLNDDLRKDARTMDFNIMINSFLKKDSQARNRELYIRTFAVLPLGEQWGIIEWIDDLNSLKDIVSKRWEEMGLNSAAKVTQIMKNQIEPREKNEKIQIFISKILPLCPPVLYKWFMQSFPDPNQWLASRNNFTKTLAVMSIVGHLLGLGDRHAENMLFDSKTGDVVHVDLNMIFEQGLSLMVPEIVPFRLTHNLIDAMGFTGVEGKFRKSCETTLDVLIKNRHPLFSVFRTLVNDPLSEWSKATAHPDSGSSALTKMETKFSINTSIKEKVNELINQASDSRNLALMYCGWAPFI